MVGGPGPAVARHSAGPAASDRSWALRPTTLTPIGRCGRRPNGTGTSKQSSPLAASQRGTWLNRGPTCKPRSVRRRLEVYGPEGPSSRLANACAIIHLGPASPPGSSSLPGARTERAAPRPCLALLRMGVAWPAPLLAPPVVSYTTVSPWPRTRIRGGLFLWPCPRVSPPGCYPAPCPVERGLSSDCPSLSLRTARDRPADPPAAFILSSGPSSVNSRPTTWRRDSACSHSGPAALTSSGTPSVHPGCAPPLAPCPLGTPEGVQRAKGVAPCPLGTPALGALSPGDTRRGVEGEEV